MFVNFTEMVRLNEIGPDTHTFSRLLPPSLTSPRPPSQVRLDEMVDPRLRTTVVAAFAAEGRVVPLVQQAAKQLYHGGSMRHPDHTPVEIVEGLIPPMVVRDREIHGAAQTRQKGEESLQPARFEEDIGIVHEDRMRALCQELTRELEAPPHRVLSGAVPLPREVV